MECETKERSAQVMQNLSLAVSFLVIPMIPFDILHILFCHSVAWSIGTTTRVRLQNYIIIHI